MTHRHRKLYFREETSDQIYTKPRIHTKNLTADSWDSLVLENIAIVIIVSQTQKMCYKCVIMQVIFEYDSID